MRYGSLEFAYSKPFADALIGDPAFRAWVLAKTRFAIVAHEARLLSDEMKAQRSVRSATWWRSHFTEACRCQGCSGQETDILAIFEVPSRTRFALHIEVKQPTDKFPARKDQAANYALRARCWSRSAPKAVLQHSDAATMLLCSAAKLAEYAPHLPKFEAVIVFEEIAKRFPHATISS